MEFHETFVSPSVAMMRATEYTLNSTTATVAGAGNNNAGGDVAAQASSETGVSTEITDDSDGTGQTTSELEIMLAVEDPPTDDK